jgi:hypothetical protein
MFKISFILLNGILFVLAFFLTAICVIVHFSTFLLSKYSDIFSDLFVFIIVLLIFVFLVSMMIMFVIARHPKESKNTSEWLIPEENKVANKIFILCFFYAIFNFLVWFPYDGSPNIIDGEYVLSNHGRILAKITEKVYWERKSREMRFMSGHLIIFSMLPMLYFYCNLAGINDQNKRQTSGGGGGF